MKLEDEVQLEHDAIIRQYITSYAQDKIPIEVQFRSLVPELNKIDRFTHLIHPYPAKLLAHIPYFFINNKTFSKEGSCVLDPFCGTGTVLLEAILANRNAYGSDINPLARLISQVKTTKIKPQVLESELKMLISRAQHCLAFKKPEVINIDYWFDPSIQIVLAKLITEIEKIEDNAVRNFFTICYSNLVRKVSFADPNISVPVKINPSRYEQGSKRRLHAEKLLKTLSTEMVIEKFISITNENIKRMGSLYLLNRHTTASIISHNSKKITQSIISQELLQNESIDLILTSPPYAGAQKYIRASSLNLNWTQLAKISDLKDLDAMTVGRENFTKNMLKNLPSTGIPNADILIQEILKINPTRAHLVATYLIELFEILNECLRVLKNDGYLVLVIGNNMVCNREFHTQDYLCQYLEAQGAKVLFKLIDSIKSYGLMTKRNKTANRISQEWILVFKK